MRVCDLDYDLPPERIAQVPADPRDAARLMVLRHDDSEFEDRCVRDLPDLLRPGDCLVLNRTRVIPARFTARRTTGGRVGGLFLAESIPGDWDVLLTGSGRLSESETLELAGGRWTMELLARLERGAWHVRVCPREPATHILERIGRMPLPPYIRRRDDDPRDAADAVGYQTIFADRPGAVAAPTAGLHFTERVFAGLRARGIAVATLTLHVGLGTFLPVETEELDDHPMHAEWFELPAETVEQFAAARRAGGRIIAVGTTVVRALESAVNAQGLLCPVTGWTDRLIQPPYRFAAVDGLLTNFHLPRSTLLALVFAFAGRERILAAYRAAIARGYRFYSYGDAMLIV